MKIKLKPPTLPNSPVDVAKVPGMPVAIPAPLPNVSAGSTFAPAPGAERRFSVRFMNALPQKLQLANVPKDLGDKLQARFGSMNRSELDRFGRLAETLMATAKPAEALGMFEAFSSLHTAILPGGHRVEPNAEGSWTVTPKGKDPFELPNTLGASAKLDDQTHLAIDALGKLRAGAQVISREVAEAAQRIPAEQMMLAGLALGVGVGMGVGMTTAAIGIGVGATAAGAVVSSPAAAAIVAASAVAVTAAVVSSTVTVVQNTPQLMNAVADVAEAAGMKEDAKLLRQGSQDVDAFLKRAPIALALKVVLLVAAIVMPTAGMKLLEQAGRGAAPSPRADPDLERGLVLLKAISQPPAEELASYAKSIRGKARDELQKLLPR